MKRMSAYIIEFFLLFLLLASLVIYVKPGAAIFYHKVTIDPLKIEATDTGFLAHQQINPVIFNADTILLAENNQFLGATTTGEVLSGNDGVFSIAVEKNGDLTFRFNPTDPSVSDAGANTYRMFIRPHIIGQTSAGLGISAGLLAFLLISFLIPQNRKMIFSTPAGILRLWASGDAGRSVISLVRDLTLPSFLSAFFVPALLLWVYSGFIRFLVSRLSTTGVNYFFTNALWLSLSVILCLSLPLLIILIRRQTSSQSTLKITALRFEPSSAILVILPLTPIVQYLIINSEMLPVSDTLKIFGYFCASTVALVLIIPLLLSRISLLKTTMTLGTAFTYTIVNMAMMSRQFSWYEKGNVLIQILFLTGVYVLVRVLNKKLVYAFIILSFISNTVMQILRVEPAPVMDSMPMEENPLLQLVDSRSPSRTPNIYLMIYDAYAQGETMRAYGIDNSAQESYLKEHGFKIYPNVYTVGASSIHSMSRVLNNSVNFYGIRRKGVSGNGVVNKALNQIGYSTLGHFVNTFFFTGTNSGYDFTYPEGTANSYLVEGTLLGEFRFDLHFYEPSHQEYIDAKRNIISEPPDTPIFCYMHTNTPGHSQSLGKCLEKSFDLYQKRVERANIEMTGDLDVLLRADPQAIIIVAGDHGPYSTKNCTNKLTDSYDASEITRLDIQDRFGVFLAIRWPEQDFEQYDEITVLQDLFPVIFAYMYQDPAILTTKIDPVTADSFLSGVYVDDGIIHGGSDDGEPLFIDVQ